MGLAMCVITELGVIPVQLAFYRPGLPRQPEQRSWARAQAGDLDAAERTPYKCKRCNGSPSRRRQSFAGAGAHLEGGAICLQPPPCDKFI